MDMKLIHGECLEEMDKLIAEGVKVDAIITDPPYGTIKELNYGSWKNSNTSWDSKIELKPLLERCNKLLRMNGSLILFSQEPYTSELITNAHGNIPFNYRLLWKKDHFANALIAKKAPVNYFEDICVFTKEYDTEFTHPLRDYVKSIVDFVGLKKKEIFEQMGHQGVCHFWRYDSLQFGLCTEKTYNELIEMYGINEIDGFKEYKELEEINKRFNKRFNLPEGAKYKSNILEYKKDYTGFHPTQKTVLLMEDLIKTYTNEGETVIDFTMGSGTCGVACQNTNRNFIGIEKDEGYFNIAKERIGKLILHSITER